MKSIKYLLEDNLLDTKLVDKETRQQIDDLKMVTDNFENWTDEDRETEKVLIAYIKKEFPNAIKPKEKLKKPPEEKKAIKKPAPKPKLKAPTKKKLKQPRKLPPEPKPTELDHCREVISEWRAKQRAKQPEKPQRQARTIIKDKVEGVFKTINKEYDKEKDKEQIAMADKAKEVFSNAFIAFKEVNDDSPAKAKKILAGINDLLGKKKVKLAKGGESGKIFSVNPHAIGKAKYVIDFYDGKSTHPDGSPFIGIATYKFKKDLEKGKEEFRERGYTEVDNVFKHLHKYAKGGEIDENAKEWAKNIAENYNDGTEWNMQSQLIDAAKDLSIPYNEVDARWQNYYPGDEADWKDVYYVLTGKALPLFAKGGETERMMTGIDWHPGFSQDEKDRIREDVEHHIAEMVEQGYTSGELAGEEPDFSGWWNIKIQEDEEDKETRNREVARAIREGNTSGYYPTFSWNAEVWKTDFAKGGETENKKMNKTQLV